MYLLCEEIVGHGTIFAVGGNGSMTRGYYGGGGSGGRIAISSENVDKLNITLVARGGHILFTFYIFHQYNNYCYINIYLHCL